MTKQKIKYRIIKKIDKSILPILEELWWQGVVYINELLNFKYQLTRKKDVRTKFFHQMITNNSNNFVVIAAFLSNRVVGFISGEIRNGYGCPILESGKIACPNFMVVEEHHRGRGIGKKLLTLFEDWAKEHEAQAVSFYTFKNNKTALGLFKDMGYLEVSCEVYKPL